MNENGIHTVLGIGFGPANIALAAAIREEAPDLDCLFLEARSSTQWQPGMLLRGSDIQNNPLRDLATLRDPRSRFTFVNFLHEQGRLLAFLNVPRHFPLRTDYAQYVEWVAEQLADVVLYQKEVTDVRHETAPVPHYIVTTEDGACYRGRSLVVASGRTPYIPKVFASSLGPNVFHSSEYRQRIVERTQNGGFTSVAVVGASQSAAEVALDLHAERPHCRIFSIMRSFGPRLKDTSPFSEEAFLPKFTDYYFDASREGKADLDAQLRTTNYSSVDGDVLDELYARRYEDEIIGTRRFQLLGNREIVDLTCEDRVVMTLRERHTGAVERVTVDVVVLATGYRDLGSHERGELFAPLLAKLAAELATDDQGVLRVERDYHVPHVGEENANAPLFLNGLCENTHGLGDAGSFSLLSLRAQTLLAGIKKRLTT